MKKNTLPTGQINVYGVHKKADVYCLEISGVQSEEEYSKYETITNPGQDFIELIIFAMGRLREAQAISDLEMLIAQSYFTTSLVHKTIAERITITDQGNVRYMSKQNVHQHIIRKVVVLITNYIRKHMPREFKMYFPATAQLISGDANA